MAALGGVLRDPMGSVVSRLPIARALARARLLVLLSGFELRFGGQAGSGPRATRCMDVSTAWRRPSFVMANQVRDGGVPDDELARRSLPRIG